MFGFLSVVLGTMLKAATPVVRDKLADLFAQLEKAAAATANPVDDVLVATLKGIMLGDKDSAS